MIYLPSQQVNEGVMFFIKVFVNAFFFACISLVVYAVMYMHAERKNRVRVNKLLIKERAKDAVQNTQAS